MLLSSQRVVIAASCLGLALSLTGCDDSKDDSKSADKASPSDTPSQTVADPAPSNSEEAIPTSSPVAEESIDGAPSTGTIEDEASNSNKPIGFGKYGDWLGWAHPESATWETAFRGVVIDHSADTGSPVIEVQFMNGLGSDIDLSGIDIKAVDANGKTVWELPANDPNRPGTVPSNGGLKVAYVLTGVDLSTVSIWVLPTKDGTFGIHSWSTTGS